LLPAEPLIPAVTLAELSVGPLVARSDQERAARQTQEAETDFDPIPFDAAAARAFAQLAACLRRTGRKTTACTDVMIAATATVCKPTSRVRYQTSHRSQPVSGIMELTGDNSRQVPHRRAFWSFAFWLAVTSGTWPSTSQCRAIEQPAPRA